MQKMGRSGSPVVWWSHVKGRLGICDRQAELEGAVQKKKKRGGGQGKICC